MVEESECNSVLEEWHAAHGTCKATLDRDLGEGGSKPEALKPIWGVH